MGDEMDLTPAELALIDLIRDPAVPVYAIAIASAEDQVVVTLAIPGDSVNVGVGRNFEGAFFRVCGNELTAGRFSGVEPETSQH